MTATDGQRMGYAHTTEAPPGWEAEVARLAESRHLAAWSTDASERILFAARLGAFWQGQAGVEVIRLFGRAIRTIDDVCEQLERSIPADEPMRRQIGGRSGIAARLRHRIDLPGMALSQYRYIIWHDADDLIASDGALFSAIADTVAGVSAEAEFVCDDLLLLTRAVYVGGTRLATLAQDGAGPFHQWQHDGVAEPFWRVVSGIERPPVLAAPIGKLLDDPETLADELLLADLDFGPEGAIG
ncbi:MAG: hypothetical protein AAFR76_02865 [Planctomycetota bacterium]